MSAITLSQWSHMPAATSSQSSLRNHPLSNLPLRQYARAKQAHQQRLLHHLYQARLTLEQKFQHKLLKSQATQYQLRTLASVTATAIAAYTCSCNTFIHASATAIATTTPVPAFACKTRPMSITSALPWWPRAQCQSMSTLIHRCSSRLC